MLEVFSVSCLGIGGMVDFARPEARADMPARGQLLYLCIRE